MPEKAPDLAFRGLDAAECEAFITGLTAHALTEGKQHDDQWIADFASGCFTQAGLRWWDSLDEKIQGSWKLLRRAMLLKFQPEPTFSGQSGDEAEKFVRMVRQKALDEKKYGDDKWITAFASACLVGDAMRWHASLDSATQNDWKLLWPALLAQYPRDAPSRALPPNPRRRGLIQVRRKNDSSPSYYLSKRLCTDATELGRVVLTMAAVEALEVEYDPAIARPQTLHIPDNQIPNCNILAIKWLHKETTRPDNWMGLCGVNSNSGSGTPGQKYVGPLSNTWKVSSTVNGKGLRPLFGANGQANLVSLSHSECQSLIWFRPGPKKGEIDLELFLEQV